MYIRDLGLHNAQDVSSFNCTAALNDTSCVVKCARFSAPPGRPLLRRAINPLCVSNNEATPLFCVFLCENEVCYGRACAFTLYRRMWHALRAVRDVARLIWQYYGELMRHDVSADFVLERVYLPVSEVINTRCGTSLPIMRALRVTRSFRIAHPVRSDTVIDDGSVHQSVVATERCVRFSAFSRHVNLRSRNRRGRMG